MAAVNTPPGPGPWLNQPIDAVDWPSSLEELAFGDAFNQPVENVKWPPSLRQLSLGFAFNQSLIDAKIFVNSVCSSTPPMSRRPETLWSMCSGLRDSVVSTSGRAPLYKITAAE